MEPSDGWCECNWLDDIESATQPCGCEGTTCTGTVRLYRDSVIHWRGKHWRTYCAFMTAKKELDILVS